MKLNEWIETVGKVNNEFDQFVQQRTKILEEFQGMMVNLFHKYWDIYPKVSFNEDATKMYVEVPYDFDDPFKFDYKVFEFLRMRFTINKNPSERYGWCLVFCFDLLDAL